MKKWIALVLALVLTVTSMPALAAYKETPCANVIDAQAERNIPVPAPGEDGNYPDNPVIEGISSTTGLPSDAPYLPVLVNIDNDTGARPQWGVAEADIIYELPIHAHYETRLTGLFTHDFSDEVGPVRSGRVHHADLREEWDAAWVFYGVQESEGTNVNVLLKEYGLARREGTILFDGTNGAKKWTPAFKDTNYHSAPHDHSVDLTKIAELMVESGHEFVERPFKFTDEKPSIGVDATKVAVLFNEVGSYYSDAYYEYDAETNKYMRSMAQGPYVDLKDESTQLGYENVIIQRTNLKFYNGAADRPTLPDIVGSGNADIFMGGKYIEGYWVRTGLQERTVFFDSEGNEIELQRGKTWITITTAHKTIVSYE